MTVVLDIVKDELHRLNLLFENAKLSNSATEVIQEFEEQIDKVHELINGLTTTWG